MEHVSRTLQCFWTQFVHCGFYVSVPTSGQITSNVDSWTSAGDDLISCCDWSVCPSLPVIWIRGGRNLFTAEVSLHHFSFRSHLLLSTLPSFTGRSSSLPSWSKFCSCSVCSLLPRLFICAVKVNSRDLNGEKTSVITINFHFHVSVHVCVSANIIVL